MRSGKIFVIGDEDAVFGLGFLGFEGIAVQDAQEAHSAIEAALADPAIALILLTENWALAYRELVDRAAANETGPLIVEIPSAQPVERAESLFERIERALGFRLEG